MTSPSLLPRRHAVPRRLAASGALLAATALLSVGLAPVLAAEPSPPKSETETSASILIVSLDSQGTDTTDDDVLLDGTAMTVRADDGDAVHDPAVDAIVFGPAAALGGLLDTARLNAGRYWVDADPPAGYERSAATLIELNTDGTRTCVWEARGLDGCQANDAGAEGLSWTMVLIRHAPAATQTATPTAQPTAAPTDPTAAPTGEVQEATGRPALTLPPTDGAFSGREPADAPAAAWLIVLLPSLSVLVARTARSTRAAAPRRHGSRLD